MSDYDNFNALAESWAERNQREFNENARLARERHDREVTTLLSIVFGVIGTFVLLMIIIVCICCCVPACFLSSQSRQRRRQLQGGQLPPMGQPGGYGQFGGQGQPMYPSQQQFNQSPSGMTNPSTSGTPGGTWSGVPPPYPVQQSPSAL